MYYVSLVVLVALAVMALIMNQIAFDSFDWEIKIWKEPSANVATFFLGAVAVAIYFLICICFGKSIMLYTTVAVTIVTIIWSIIGRNGLLKIISRQFVLFPPVFIICLLYLMFSSLFEEHHPYQEGHSC